MCVSVLLTSTCPCHLFVLGRLHLDDVLLALLPYERFPSFQSCAPGGSHVSDDRDTISGVKQKADDHARRCYYHDYRALLYVL